MSLLTDILASRSASKDRDEYRTALGGLIVPGSWSAADSTAQVLMLDTAAVFTDTDSPVIVLAEAMSSGRGDQYAPVGNERVRLHRTSEGWAYQIIHGDDDSPGAPSGERWIMHLAQSGSYNTYLKFTNDGAISGDGLGGIKALAGTFGSIATTGGHSIVLNDHTKTLTVQSAGGHSIVLNDSSKEIVVTSAGGLTITMNDNTGVISFCGGTSSGDALVRQSDLVTLLSNIQTKIDTWASTSLQSGSGASGITTLTSITPTASSKTFTA